MLHFAKSTHREPALSSSLSSILKQIERLCTRLIVHENDCWTRDKPEVRFRLYRDGPLISPHEALWTIFSGVHVSPVWDTRIALHD